MKGADSVPDPSPTADPPRSKARTYRMARSATVARRRGWAVAGVALVVLAVATYTIATSGPLTHGYSPPGPGSSIVVQFGTPTTEAMTCAEGGTAYVETIPWLNSSGPVWTAGVSVIVFEITDGDFIGDPGVVANASPTVPCAGTPPPYSGLWYAVLLAPNSTTVLAFTDDAHWTAVTPGPSNVQVPNGSSLLLVTQRSLAESGRGLEVTGLSNSIPVRGSVTL